MTWLNKQSNIVISERLLLSGFRIEDKHENTVSIRELKRLSEEWKK
jgi:hypothetical protein